MCNELCKASDGSMDGTDGHARLCPSAPPPSRANAIRSPVPAAIAMLSRLARREARHNKWKGITVLRGDAGPAPLGIARLAALKLGGGRAARAAAARDLRNHNRRVRRSGGRVPAAKSQHSTRLNVAAEQADGQLGPRTCSARVSAAVGSSQQSSQRPPSMACHLGARTCRRARRWTWRTLHPRSKPRGPGPAMPPSRRAPSRP